MIRPRIALIAHDLDVKALNRATAERIEKLSH
jgi:hypothetical protein